MLVFSPGVAEEDTAGAVTLPDGVTTVPRGMISDLDSSNFAFSNTPNVFNPTNYTFLNTPLNDGRIWADKSVNAGNAFIYDTAGGVVDVVRSPANEFLVTLSALSQSVNTSEIIVEPSDTVFIIDVSGSMVTNTVPGDGRTRIAVVIEALNEAIDMLMKADDNNRVSVVVYGGQSISSQNHVRALPILSLGRYDAGTAIFTVSGSNVTVRSNVTTAHRTFTVEGGTPTQLGTRIGADILLGVDNTDEKEGGTQIDLGTPGSPYWVTRKPNIILMTDGEPTFGWTDYKLDTYANFSGTTYDYNVGNGSTGDMGLTALTVMTASYMKQLVRNHYYGTMADKPENASKSVGFFTLGLGVNSSISNGMLDPYGKSASGVPNAQLVVQNNINMLTVLDAFAPGSGTVPAFPVIAKGTSTTNPSRPNQSGIVNTGGLVPTCNYDTLSFTAMDAQSLKDAFSQITQSIVSSGNYSTNTGDDKPQYSGYLVFSDVIGEYMKVTGVIGTWYNNLKYDSSTFGTAITATAPVDTDAWDMMVENITKFLSHAGTDDALDEPAARDLIESNIAGKALQSGSANSRIIYYADNNRDFVSSYFDLSGDPFHATDKDAADAGKIAKVELYTVRAPAVNSLNGDPSNLMYLVFQVVTVLKDGNFANYFSEGNNLVSVLKSGDQIVRWYIPAELIPLREVRPVINPDTGRPDKDDFGFDAIQVSESVPLRVIYTVAPDVDKIRTGLTSLYKSVNKGTADNSYYFYTNRWRGMDGRVQTVATPSLTRNDAANMTQAFFVPSDSNPFYKQDLVRNAALKAPNITGPTGTSPWLWRNVNFARAPSGRVEVQGLGNNGRIELRIQAQLTLIKSFNLPEGLTMDQISPISFTIYGTDGTNEIFRANILYPNDFNGDRITINVPPGTYVLRETGGWAANYMLNSLSPSAVLLRAGDSFTVNGPTGIVNAYTPMPGPHGLRVRKMFHGLLAGEAPPGFRMVITTPAGDDLPFDFTAVTGPGAFIPFTAGNMANETGIYRIREESTAYPGMVLNNVSPPLPYEFEVTEAMWNQNNEVLFVANNFYSTPSYSIDLEKVTQPTVLEMTDEYGHVITREPVDLAFKIERAGTADDPGGYLNTIRWADLVNGKARITNLRAGTYTITELGSVVPGFDDPRVTLTVNGAPADVVKDPNDPNAYSYRFTLSGDGNVNLAFRFTNIYIETPPPPPVPPGPSPKTGDSRSLIMPFIALSFGIACITGAELYRRRSIKQKNSK